jgi:hypothetical protein
MNAEELFLKKFGNKMSAMESWVIRFAEDYAVMKLEEKKELAQSIVSNSLDLRELERKLSKALEKETRESFQKWFAEQKL